MFLVWLAQASDCMSYQCKTSNVDFPTESTCVYVKENVTYLNPCEGNYQCNFETFLCEYQPSYTPGKNVAGT